MSPKINKFKKCTQYNVVYLPDSMVWTVKFFLLKTSTTMTFQKIFNNIYTGTSIIYWGADVGVIKKFSAKSQSLLSSVEKHFTSPVPLKLERIQYKDLKVFYSSDISGSIFPKQKQNTNDVYSIKRFAGFHRDSI